MTINLSGLITKEDKFEELKQAKLKEIDRARNEALNSGFEYNGMMFDSDDKSIQRINAIATLSLLDPTFETDYITQDNTIVHLNAEDIANLGAAAAQHEAYHVFKARQLKDDVLLALSAEAWD